VLVEEIVLVMLVVVEVLGGAVVVVGTLRSAYASTTSQLSVAVSRVTAADRLACVHEATSSSWTSDRERLV